MTKAEFQREAGKANIPPELYGAVLRGQFRGPFGAVSGGKVVGIEWQDEWQTREEYNYVIGTYNVTSLGKAPYIILSKNRKKYPVEAWKVRAYLDKNFRAWISQKIKDKELL